MNLSRLEPVLILGAPRAGTTAMFHYLAQHPQVLAASEKECHFFDRFYQRGAEFLLRQFFPEFRPEAPRVLCEASPCNLHLPFVADRIAETFPRARLVAMLRHPVERAWSHWWLFHSTGQDPLGFAQAIAANQAEIAAGRSFEGPDGAELWQRAAERGRVRPPHLHDYLEYGHYASSLRYYLSRFPREQIQVVWFEDFCRDAAGQVREICRFAGLATEGVRFDLHPVNPGLGRLGARLRWVAGLIGVQGRVSLSLADRVRRLLDRVQDRAPRIPSQERPALVDYFRPHNRALEDLLGVDLSHWDA